MPDTVNEWPAPRPNTRLLYEEECYCSPPLSIELTTVFDMYFAEIQIEQLSEVEGWARRSDLPALSENIQTPCASSRR